MNNATNPFDVVTKPAKDVVTETGKLARGMIHDGLEVHAEMYEQEPELKDAPFKGIDRKLHRLVQQYGVQAILESLHDAAIGAAEVHEDCDDPMDNPEYGVVAVRLKVFGRKLRSAMDALK